MSLEAAAAAGGGGGREAAAAAAAAEEEARGAEAEAAAGHSVAQRWIRLRVSLLVYLTGRASASPVVGRLIWTWGSFHSFAQQWYIRVVRRFRCSICKSTGRVAVCATRIEPALGMGERLG
jgi:hypothetical protein